MGFKSRQFRSTSALVTFEKIPFKLDGQDGEGYTYFYDEIPVYRIRFHKWLLGEAWCVTKLTGWPDAAHFGHLHTAIEFVKDEIEKRNS